MFWMRLLLYLDSIKFFGAMLVVLKVMMRESLIFFALLSVIIIGFLQAFIGMDNADNDIDATVFILQSSKFKLIPDALVLVSQLTHFGFVTTCYFTSLIPISGQRSYAIT